MQDEQLKKLFQNYLYSSSLTLSQFMASTNQAIDISKFQTLIWDNKFVLNSTHRLKFLKVFVYVVQMWLKQKNTHLIYDQEAQKLPQTENERLSQTQILNTDSEIKRALLSQAIGLLMIILETKMIFLEDHDQWECLFQILMKIILGPNYQIDLTYYDENASFDKHRLFNFYTNKIISSKKSQQSINQYMKSDKQMLMNFMNGLKNLNIFNKLFNSCLSQRNIPHLFQLFYLLLIHSTSDQTEDSSTYHAYLGHLLKHTQVKNNQNFHVFSYKILKTHFTIFDNVRDINLITFFMKTIVHTWIYLINAQESQVIQSQKKQLLKRANQLLLSNQNQLKSIKYEKNWYHSCSKTQNFQYTCVLNSILKLPFELLTKKRLQYRRLSQTIFSLLRCLKLYRNINCFSQKIILIKNITSYLSHDVNRLANPLSSTIKFVTNKSYVTIPLDQGESTLNFVIKVREIDSSMDCRIFQIHDSSNQKTYHIKQKSFDQDFRYKIFTLWQFKTNHDIQIINQSQKIMISQVQEAFCLQIQKNKISIKAKRINYVLKKQQWFVLFTLNAIKSRKCKLKIKSSSLVQLPLHLQIITLELINKKSQQKRNIKQQIIKKLEKGQQEDQHWGFIQADQQFRLSDNINLIESVNQEFEYFYLSIMYRQLQEIKSNIQNIVSIFQQFNAIYSVLNLNFEDIFIMLNYKVFESHIQMNYKNNKTNYQNNKADTYGIKQFLLNLTIIVNYLINQKQRYVQNYLLGDLFKCLIYQSKQAFYCILSFIVQNFYTLNQNKFDFRSIILSIILQKCAFQLKQPVINIKSSKNIKSQNKNVVSQNQKVTQQNQNRLKLSIKKLFLQFMQLLFNQIQYKKQKNNQIQTFLQPVLQILVFNKKKINYQLTSQTIKSLVVYLQGILKIRIQEVHLAFYKRVFYFTKNKLIQQLRQLSTEQIKFRNQIQNKVKNEDIHIILETKILSFSYKLKLFILLSEKAQQTTKYAIQQILKNVLIHQKLEVNKMIIQTLWFYSIQRLEANLQSNQTNESFKLKKIVQILVQLSFQMINDHLILRILETIIFYPQIYFNKHFDWKFQERLNLIASKVQSFSLTQIIINSIKKLQALNRNKQAFKISSSKTILTLIYRTIMSIDDLLKFNIQEKYKLAILNIQIRQILSLIIKLRIFQQSNQLLKIEQMKQFACDIDDYLQIIKDTQNQFNKNQLSVQNVSYRINLNKFLQLSLFLKNKLSNIDNFSIPKKYYEKIQENSKENTQYDNQYFKYGSIKDKNYYAEGQNLQAIRQIFTESEFDILIQRKVSQYVSNFHEQYLQVAQTQANDSNRRVFNRENQQQQYKLSQSFGLSNLIQTQIKFMQSLKFKFNSRIQIKNQFQNQNLVINLNQRFFKQIQTKQKQYQFTIDNYCDQQGFRPLLKKQKIKNKLIKIINSQTYKQKSYPSFFNTQKDQEICTQIQNSKKIILSAFKNLTEQNERILKIIKQPQLRIPRYRSPQRQRQLVRQTKSYLCSYITASQFYVGTIIYHPAISTLVFRQNNYLDNVCYQQISALQNQQSTIESITSQPLTLRIKMVINKSYYIKKSYLKKSNSMQVYSQQKSYFFRFHLAENRDRFCSTLHKKAQVNYQNVHVYTKCWQKGIISNFQYLMRLNKFSQRSFNDISQYYVFPWTVINFQAEFIDEQFMDRKQNFRDLTLPIGKINPDKFMKLKSNYQISLKNSECFNQPFLYGSFYSNPAIVSYYMIRVHPFSCHQFYLQDNKFDKADRLFSSISATFNSTYKLSDYKQLLPQFYSSAQFLKNRNRYNFGKMQNGVKVDQVGLPKWVNTNTPDQYIFRMRKIIQSPIVTLNLHKWIDLIFGKFTIKSQAMKADNLFNQNVYGQSLIISEQQKNISFCHKYLKQFGQIPKTIFSQQHQPSLMKNLLNGQQNLVKRSRSFSQKVKDKFMRDNIAEYQFKQCQNLGQKTEKSFIRLVGIKNKKQPYSINKKEQIQNKDNKIRNSLVVSQKYLISKNNYGLSCHQFRQDGKNQKQHENELSINNIDYLQILSIDNSKNDEIYILTIEKQTLFARKIQRGMMKLSLFGKSILMCRHIKLMKIVGAYLILITTNNSIQFFKTDESSVIQKKSSVHVINLNGFALILIKEFKISQQNIQKIDINQYLSMLLVIDEQKNVYLFNARDDSDVHYKNRFKVRLTVNEDISSILIHNMGYILLLTNKKRIILLNLFGQVILSIVVSFEIQSQKEKTLSYSIDNICFWNQQSSDIIISAYFFKQKPIYWSQSKLYKVDLFDMAQKRLRSSQKKIQQKQQKLLLKEQQKQNQHIKTQSFEFNQYNKKMYQKFNIEFIEREGRFKSSSKNEQSQIIQKIVDLKIKRQGRHWKIICLDQKGDLFILRNRHYQTAKCVKILTRQKQD